MFAPQSFPLALNEETQTLEEEARRYQAAFLTRGMKAKGRQKAFKDMILERPKLPYFTRATESLAAAIEANPLQNHGKAGVLVEEEMLRSSNDAIVLSVPLPDDTMAQVHVYSDMSCTLSLPGSTRGEVRAMTLPFKLRTARLSHQDRERFVKLGVRMRDGTKRGGVMIADQTKGAAIRLDAGKHALHADVLRDLGIEIEAVITQTEIDGPIYQITPQKIQDSEKDHTGGLEIPTCPAWSATLYEDQLGWFCRGKVTAFDVHLPFMNMSIDQLIALRKLSETAAALAWQAEGLSGKAMSASLMVYAGNPISGPQIDFRIQRSMQDSMMEHIEGVLEGTSLPGMEDDPMPENPSADEMVRFLTSFHHTVMASIRNTEIFGYQYLYLTGMFGSWVPIVLAEIRLDAMSDTEESPEALTAQVAFHRQRLEKMVA